MLVRGSSRSSRTSRSWYALCSMASSYLTPATNAATRDTTKTATITNVGVQRRRRSAAVVTADCRKAHEPRAARPHCTVRVSSPGCGSSDDLGCHDVARVKHSVALDDEQRRHRSRGLRQRRWTALALTTIVASVVVFTCSTP